ncbi:MAG: lipoyl synthase [Candidatus Omnitrophica bacterium]|nr:lipoyl synthase [Candidatus Omnitrophota bacterium]
MSSLKRLPSWLQQELPVSSFCETSAFVSKFAVHTVCQEAHCPNITHCFSKKSMTFLLLGNICTRSCVFCAVEKNNASVLSVDEDEPFRIRDCVHALGLKYVVLTSVTRDDLEDGGARIFARTIELLRAADQEIKIEVLVPDLEGNVLSIKSILKAAPDCMGHNIETVQRLSKILRPQSDYARSLKVIRTIKDCAPQTKVKSSLMVGLGETEGEVIEAMRDLRAHHCDICTVGQYLAASSRHYPVQEFVSPAQFARYQEIGRQLGFTRVFCGPKVRSSYYAEDIYQEALHV